jgi:hypothetical protein
MKVPIRLEAGNLAVVYVTVLRPPQWYVATADGVLIFGPFSSREEAMEIAKGGSSPGSVSEKES